MPFVACPLSRWVSTIKKPLNQKWKFRALQEARNWDAMGAEPRKGAKAEKQLDFSAAGPGDAGPTAALAPLAIGKSRVDADEDDYSSDEDGAEVGGQFVLVSPTPLVTTCLVFCHQSPS